MKNLNLIKRLWTDSHEKQSPQRFARYAAMLIMLLTLGVGQMWADWSFSGTSYMYFYKKGNWSDTYKYLVIGKDKWQNDWSSVYSMAAVTGNSNLWVATMPSSGWSDATYMGIVGTGSSTWGDGNWGSGNLSNAAHYTASYTGGIGTSNTQRYILVPANGNNGASISLTYLGTNNPNYTITVKAKVSENNGKSYSEVTSPATLSASSKKFTAYNSCNSSTSLSSGTITCGYAATTTLTAPDTDPTGYTFVGWYNSSGARQTTSKTLTIYPTANATYYAYYKANQYNGTIDANGGAENKTYTATYGTTSLTIAAAPTRTGYTLNGYYKESGCSNLIASSTKELQVSTSYTNAAKQWTNTSSTAPTLYAGWTAKTTTITLNNQDATTPGSTSVTATYDAAMPAITLPTKTGYTFGGYWGSPGGSGPQYYNADGSSTQNWNNENSTYTLYAKWTAKTTTITLDQTGAASTGSVTTRTGTYNADMPTITGSGSLPTAPQGYAFMGYYDALEPLGTKYYNADGTSAHTWDKEDAAVTLYPYFKKAAVTAITFSPAAVVAPNATITATPTLDPMPTGTNKVCWEVQYSNGTPLPSQPMFTPGASNAVSFSAPAASATYRLQATLKTGDNCASGTELSVYSTTFQVAGSHTVTIEYKCGDEVIKASTELEGIEALEWSDDITKTDVFGYHFVRWDAGDGVSIKNGEGSTTTSTSTTIKIKAIYDGKLTAVYAQNDYIYFKNTLGWDDVYVYFYSGSGYWGDKGAGATGAACIGKGRMSLVEGETDIYYWDYGANITGGAAMATQYVAFTWGNKTTYANFSDGDAVYPTEGGNAGFKSGTPMFVPLSKTVQTKVTVNGAPYYNNGYWTKYKGGTGYWVDIFYSKGGAFDKSVGFVEGESAGMPFTSTVNLSGGSTLGFKIGRKGAAGGGSDVYYYTTTDVTMSNATKAKSLTNSNSQTGITTNVSGDYIFTLTCASNGTLNITVKYPAAAGDYRIVYKDRAAWSGSAHSASWCHPSATIGKNRSATEPKTDIVSFYVSKADGASASMKFQYISSINNSSVTWQDVTGGAISAVDTISKSGVYNFYLSQPAGGASITVDSVRPYKGNYYIRSTMANSKWDNYTSDPDHLVNHSDYAEAERGFTHYWVKYITNGSDIRYVIANDYSPCISDTLLADVGSSPVTTTGGTLSTSEAGVNIRSMWDYRTNKLSRAYLTGPVSNQYLLLRSLYQSTASNNRVFKSWTSSEVNTRLNHASFTESAVSYNLDTLLFKDNQNWVYQLDIYARPAATYKLTALINGHTTFIRGLAGSYATAANIDTLLGGNPASTKAYHVRMVYDFKSDRMMKAWVPDGEITENLAIDADIMLVREHQEAGEQISFNEGSLSKVKTVYGVMRFNRWTLNNKEKTGGHSVVGDPKSTYERALYWISFPFDVNLSDVFGFGTYGTHWIIMEYDGAERAKKGYWKDSEGFWKHVTNRTGKILEANKGYVLGLDLDLMKDNNTSFWTNNIEQVELFFPSTEEVSNIQATNVTTSVASHLYDASAHPGHTDDRTYKDSHWNMIGVPSYANYGTTLTSDGSTTVNWATPTNADLPYLYEWNMVDNTYTVQTGTTYPFQSMHAYMVQYHGNLYWSMASATPPVSPIVARRMYAEKPQNVEMRLELSQNEKMVDQTFVNMKDAEEISAGFKFDEDLCKEFNAGKANIYTLIENYLPAAGNTLPMSEQTTLVPVGVKTTAAGEYTFAMPEGTNGVNVVLIDNIAGTRTNLALSDYTVTLGKGDLSDRFMLEIAPIKQMPTDIENVQGDNVHSTKVRKVMIDGILYIVKEGKVFDAHGNRVK